MKPGLAVSVAVVLGVAVVVLGVAAGACALGAGGVGVCASAGASNSTAAALIIRDRFSMRFSHFAGSTNSRSDKTSRVPAVFRPETAMPRTGSERFQIEHLCP